MEINIIFLKYKIKLIVAFQETVPINILHGPIVGVLFLLNFLSDRENC